MSIPPLHTVPISGRRNQHKGNAGTTRLYAGEVARRVKRQPSQGKRHDIIQLGGENLAAGLMASHYSCSPVIRKMPMRFMQSTARAPARSTKQAGLCAGNETFRLDYYSAMQVLERLKALFKH